ncbi:MAG: tetratricopeptide repeat protein [Planctomycetes bacterium]|nr:tetratricopeptide repeat protein [Planctomycetota bacterium]
MDAEIAYVFRHALVREAAYELQPPGDRAVLHALVIEIVEAALASDDPLLDAWALELADHARAAQAFRRTANLALLKALADKEVGYLVRAQKYALAEYDNGVAVALGTRIADHAAASYDDRFSALVQAGEVLVNMGSPAQARERFERANALAREAGNGRDEARSMRAIGISFARAEGSPSAIPWMEKALEAFRQAGDKPGAALALGNLALLRASMAPPEETLAAYDQALELLVEEAHENGQASTLNNKGNLLRSLGRREQAESCLRRAIELHRKNRERHQEGTVLSNLAALLFETGRPEEAAEAIAQAVAIARETGNRTAEGVALLHRAISRFRAGQHADAEQDYLNALALARESGNVYWEAITLMNFSVVLEDTGRPQQAITHGELARELLRRLNARHELGIVTCNLANLVATVGVGDLPRARTLYEEGVALLAEARQRSIEGVHRGGYAVTLKRLGDASAESELAKARALLEEFGTPAGRDELEKRWAAAGQ